MNKHFYSALYFAVPANDNANTGGIDITTVDAAIPEFWANIALGALGANTVMANLVNRDYDDMVATKGDVVNIVKRGALTVNDKATGKQITLQTPQNVKIPVTLNKHKEISWLIEDAANAKAITDAVNYVQDAAIALGEQIDKDLLALYSSCTNTAGSSSSDISIATILEAREKLNVAKAPINGRYVVVSPEDETALLKLEQFTSAEWSNENQVALREAIMGRKYGFTFVMDQQVNNTTSGSSKVRHNLAFHKDAFVLVTRPLPAPPVGGGAVSSTLQVDGISVRVTRSYSQRDGGTLWTLDVLYGVACLREETHAVHILGGNVMPMSISASSVAVATSGSKTVEVSNAAGTVSVLAAGTDAAKLTVSVSGSTVTIAGKSTWVSGSTASVIITDGVSVKTVEVSYAAS